MSDFIIKTLRGGLNNTDPANAVPDDQVVRADNVEFVDSMLGERRLGATAIDITGSDLEGHERVSWLFRHMPSTDQASAELWALGVTDATLTSSLCYKTTTWTTVLPLDDINVASTNQFQLRGASFHGKLYICYKSTSDRLHVFDGSTLRRTGLAEPSAPLVTDTGAGTFAGTRYYRVRFTRQFASYTIRSETSETTTFIPSGTGSAARIAKPATISEGETHWEIEASVDNANFYVIATVAVGTTTYDDSTPFSPGYADDFDLAPQIGEYTLIPSPKFIVVDDDRLIWANGREDEALASRVGWTPVNKADGDGNDKRMDDTTDPFIDLDSLEGGEITDLVSGFQGYIYVFKYGHIYQLVRTGNRSSAYRAYNLTKDKGAIEGSVCTGLDQEGNPALFFLDPSVGPCIIGRGGIRTCGADVKNTWNTANLDATKVVARALYYPHKRQVHWWVATEDSEIPNLRMVLHSREMRNAPDGARRGWALWTGPSSAAFTTTLFAENIDDDTDRSNDLVPFIGVEGDGLIWRTDIGDDDNGTEYDAHITTKPYVLAGMLHQFEVKSGCILMTASGEASIDVSATKDFGYETVVVPDVSCEADGDETQVIVQLKDLHFSELRAVQIEFSDPDISTSRWEINEFSLRHTAGQKA